MKHRVTAAVLEADYGQAYTRRNARVVSSRIGAADGMELADIPDIDRPDKRLTVRVARRVDPLFAILDPLDREGPGHVQFLAADKLRRDSARADGRMVTSGLYSAVVAIQSGTPDYEPPELRIAAQARCRAAWLAIYGRDNHAYAADVVRLVVLGFVTLATVDGLHGWLDHSRKSRRLLDEGLDRLAAHYGC